MKKFDIVSRMMKVVLVICAVVSGTVMQSSARAFPIPSISFDNGSTQNVPLCLGAGALSLNTKLKASGGAGTYTWTVTSGPSHGSLGGFPATAGAGTSVGPTGTSYTPTGGYTGTDAYTIQVSDGTNTASSIINVTVNPLPAVITGILAVCPGTTTTLSDVTTGGTWTSGTPGMAAIGSTGVVTGAGAGNPVITYALPTGCIATAVLTVNALPSTMTGIPTVCVGSTTTLASTPLGGTWSSSNPTIASVSLGVGVVTGNAAGTAIITYTIPTGCYMTTTVTVMAVPASITGTLSVCAGSTTVLSSSPTGGTWTSSNGSVASVSGGTVTGVAAGNATIKYALTSGCFSTAVVTVNTTPSTITGIRNVCIGSTTALASLPITGTWTSSTITQATVVGGTGVVTGVAAGNPTITYTLPGTGCFNTATITVNPVPASITGTLTVCVGATITLGSTTPGGTWSSSSSQATVIGSTGVVTGVSAGNPVITYTLPTGCFKTTTITVNPIPAAISGIPVVCVGSTVTLSETTGGGNWTSSVPGQATVGIVSGIVSGVAAGNPVISYTLPTGCYAVTTATVNALLASITGTINVCAGLTTALNTTSTGGTWSSSNPAVGSVSATGVVTGRTAGVVNISYTLSTGCAAVAVVTVNPLPAIITGITSVCVGGTRGLSDASAGGTWSSGNIVLAGVGSVTGIVAGNAIGNTTIIYTLPTGCIATTPITVNPLPSAISGATTVCVSGTTTLTNTGGGTWGSSATTVATIGSTGIVNGISAGTAVITYTLPTGCFITMNLTVNPLPAAITGTFNVCPAATTTLSDASAGGTWSSSSTTTALIGSLSGIVTGNTAGVATITYTLPTGCLATAPVTVNPLPALITGTTNVCVGLTTTLSDATGGGRWSSSNTGLATAGPTSGIVTGISAGTPSVTYTLPTGCFAVAPITVNALPATISATATSICVGGTATFSDVTTGGTWSSSNAGIATVGSTGVVTGTGSGSATITYTLPTGCIATMPITVRVTPVAITGTPAVCAGLQTLLASAPLGGTWFSSNLAVATLGAVPGMVNGISAGTVTITYILTSGCFATTTATVNATPLPISGVLSVCVGATSNLSDAMPGGNWSSSVLTVAPINTTGTVTGVAAGTTIITYAMPATGCKATAVVTVNALPTAIGGTVTVCVGATTTLTNTGSGTWSSGTIGVATVGSASGVVSGISAGTTAITFTSGAGCTTATVVTVNPLPASITGTLNACAGATTALTDASGGGTWTSGSTSVATIGSSSGTVSGLTAGTSAITYALPTGCRITGSVTINPLPSAITGTLAVCIGSATTLSSAATGGTWSSSSASTASVSTSGVVNGVAAGNATITYTLPTGCLITAAVTVNPLPAAITGTGSICIGQTITLSTTATGGSWSTGSSLASVSSSGVVTGIGTGIPVITYAFTTGCSRTATVTVNALPATITGTRAMCVGSSVTLSDVSGIARWSSSNSSIATVGSATGIVSGVTAGTATITFALSTTCAVTTTITINAAPSAYTVSGGGVYCAGGAGLAVGLANSQTGVSYQLYNSGTATGIALAGTGSSLNFGLKTLAGVYTVIATNTTGCTTTMSGSVAISINPLPSVFSVTGGGSYCSGGTGLAVGLSGSEPGVSYQLYNGIAVGSPKAGTGSALSFGFQPAGTYTVVATGGPGCTSTMSGAAVITVLSAPTPYPVTGGGAFCSGGAGMHVGLGSSAAGITYQLMVGGTAIGTPMAGTGSPLDFGLQTTGGTYTVSALNPTTLCTSVMTGSVGVTVNPIPSVYTVTGGGSFCSGGTGVAVGLSNSQTGVTYQLRLGTASIGSPVAGTGTAISFGLQTASGVYTVVGSSGGTCSSTMTGSATVGITIAPTTYSMTGGGSLCSGGTGVPVGIFGSQSGVTYQLFNGTTPVSTPRAGTGAAISFGLQTGGGTYTVVATNTGTGCTSTMSGVATVVVNSTPAIAAVTGGGSYCTGGAGRHVGIASSATGVNYQLYLGGSPIGFLTPGVGAALDFGLQTAVGTYTVVATDGLSGCSSNMTGSAVVFINALPATHTVTGGGHLCAGGTGVLVGLNTTNVGITYQLYVDGVATGSPHAGTGSAISFGLQTVGGTYTVVATNTATGCQSTMSGSATVTVDTAPTVFAMTGGGSLCPGGIGWHIGLTGSATGDHYRLYRGTSTVGGPVTGTGSALDFGIMTTAGTYTVIATTSGSSCTSTMTGSSVITVSPLPGVYTVTGGGSFCSGGGGVAVGLSGSASSISYELYHAGVSTGIVVTGTGSPITFGLLPGAGVYTVVATSSAGCTSSMSGSATITVNATPAAFTVTGGGGYCTGTGLHIGLSGSATGVSYRLYLGTAPVGSVVTGTGSAIDFGTFTTLGTYTVRATSTTGGCTATMTGSASVTGGSLPTVFTVTGGGTLCSGGAGYAVGLSGSTTGVSYKLFRGTVAAGSPVIGTGSAISFGAQTTAGGYTVVATAPGGCIRSMGGSATITVNPLPTVYTVSGTATICSGTPGSHIMMSSSTTGISYRLYLGTLAVGTALSGTGAALDLGAQTAAGTYTVMATNTITGCTSTMSGSGVITVNPSPNVTGSVYSVAPSSTITLSGSMLGGRWTSSTSSVATVASTSGVVTGVSSGSTTITYTLVSTGCFGTHTVSVTPTGHRDANDTTTGTGAAMPVFSSSIYVAPNPNKGTFTVRGSLGVSKDVEVFIEMTDMSGRVIFTRKVTAANGELNEAVQLNNIANGMYLMSVHSEADNKVFHVAIEQ